MRRIYISAEPGMKHSTIYMDESGKYYRFSNGTWTWRNHNPGNIRPRSHGKKWTAQIGVVDNFAVFPNNELGHSALIELLKTVYFKANIYLRTSGKNNFQEKLDDLIVHG